jgi:hypothetical protein
MTNYSGSWESPLYGSMSGLDTGGELEESPWYMTPLWIMVPITLSIGLCVWCVKYQPFCKKQLPIDMLLIQ